MQHTQPVFFSFCLALGLALLFPVQSSGAEQAASQVQETDRFDSMDTRRDYLSDKIAYFASYVDRFFGGDRHYQESNQSVIQMSIGRVMGYGGNPKFNLAARVNVSLPATEGRLRLLLETDPEKNLIAEPALVPVPALVPTPTPAATTSAAAIPAAAPSPGHAVLHDKVVIPASVAIAARYTIMKGDAWHFNTDWGLKFPIPVTPFVRARGSYEVPLGEWRLKAAQSAYWFNTLGVGETSQLDLEHVISAPLLFRSSTAATWLNNTRNFDLRQDLSVYHTLDDRSAFLYQASAIGVSNPKFQVSDYVLLMYYRYRMHKEWLFFEITPQLHFPRERNYKPNAALSVRLEIQFDETR